MLLPHMQYTDVIALVKDVISTHVVSWQML